MYFIYIFINKMPILKQKLYNLTSTQKPKIYIET